MTTKPAIEGGRPVRRSFLPFARPDISNAEIMAVVRTLRSGWLTMGPRVLEFEEAFRKYIGARHAVAFNSCTAALHTTLVALRVGPGDEVVTTPFTFAATANVVALVGARPVFADVEPDTLNLDPSNANARLCARTKAVIPVHYGGQPCDLDALAERAHAHGAFLLEDAAHAFGAEYRDRRIGSTGTAAFSFYATKNLTTGEGGMVTTDDSDLADRLRLLRLHGISRDAWKRYTVAGDWYYEVVEAGFKYNMTDTQAAMGLVQLRRADGLLKRRRSHAQYLAKEFKDVPNLTLPQERPDTSNAWHLYPIRLNLPRLRIDRAKFIEALRAENIGSSVHFIPLHLQPYYRDRFGYRRGDFPVAEAAYERIISLPFYAGMTREDLDDVVEAVGKIAQYYGR